MHTISTQLGQKDRPRLWTKEYSLLVLANLFLCFGFHTMPATLPAYVKHQGGSPLEVSLVVGLFSIFSLVFRVLGGSIADLRGPKKVALVGAGIVLLTTFSFPFLPIPALLAARMIEGIGWGLGSASIATAVSATVCPQRRGEGIGYYSVTTVLAMGLMSLVSIPVMNSFGFSAVTFGASASLVLSMACLLFSPGGANGSKKAKAPLSSILKPGSIIEVRALLPSGLCFLATITVCGVVSFLMLYGEEIGAKGISIFFAGFTAMALLTRPFSGKIYDRHGHVPLVLAGTLAMATGLLVLSFARSTPLFVLASAFFGMGYGAVHPSLQTWCIERSPEDNRGAANGTYLSAMDLAYTLGSIILAAAASQFSYAAMYRYSLAFLVIMLAVYLISQLRSRQ